MYSLNFARYDAAPPPADLSLSIDARSVVEALVRASGLNPANATVEDMDRVGVRFGCKVDQCNARTLGFDWKSAVGDCLPFYFHVVDMPIFCRLSMCWSTIKWSRQKYTRSPKKTLKL